MSDCIEVGGKKYYEEGYLKLANDNTRRARQMCLAILPFFEAIRDCGQPPEWEENESRVDYVTVQIDKHDWQACKKTLQGLKDRFNA